MKTRTLLLLSVGTALMILLAGGVLLFQLSGQDDPVEVTPLDVATTVGDAELTVAGSTEVDGVLRVDVEIGGIDDPDGIDNFELVTGDQRLAPLQSPEAGRCVEVTEQPQQCTLDFDVSATEGSSRVLVLRRGEDQATWRLS
ncbi:hypothetical protein [Ilumatobacter nonamiensis]|uniref:hypothetical protein n=1 Tax=Ilumatobacter nonamiensis TaxID=467093 RepID=UPI00058E517B|nr:hypothetical protein [Ilumatobacter nonamiensis]